jgi:hypothetical protein
VQEVEAEVLVVPMKASTWVPVVPESVVKTHGEFDFRLILRGFPDGFGF